MRPKCVCGDEAMYVVTGHATNTIEYVCPSGITGAVEHALMLGAGSVRIEEVPASAEEVA